MLFFILYVFLETLVSVQISGMLGGFWTFIEIVFSVLVGITLLKNMDTTIGESFGALRDREISSQDFERLAIFHVVGAFLIIVPGFLTDIVGVLLQFNIFALMVMRNMFAKNKKNDTPFDEIKTKRGDNEIIDVEVIDSDSKH